MKTTEKLAAALEEAGAPAAMITEARGGYYHDYLSPLAFPLMQLVADAKEAGLVGIAARAMDGDFDATSEEADAWAASPEGQAAIRELTDRG